MEDDAAAIVEAGVAGVVSTHAGGAIEVALGIENDPAIRNAASRLQGETMENGLGPGATGLLRRVS